MDLVLMILHVTEALVMVLHVLMDLVLMILHVTIALAWSYMLQ